MTAFHPDDSRIFLDTALADVMEHLPLCEGRALNVGCGTEGRYCELLSSFTVEGVDIANSKEQMPWRYHQCDASCLPFSDAIFDLAVAIESFEHIENNVTAMSEIARTLTPSGWLVVSTPTHWTWPFEFGRHGPHYYSRQSLEKLIIQAGLEVQWSYACGGLLFWLSNIAKSWLSPIGLRLIGKRWWTVIDTILLPLYHTSRVADCMLPFPATNWLMVAKKPGG